MQHAQISLKIWRLQYPADDPHQEAAMADPSAEDSLAGKDSKDSTDAAPEGRGAGVIDLNDGEVAESAAAFSASAKGEDRETHSSGSEGSEGEDAGYAQSMDAITARSRRGVRGPMGAIGRNDGEAHYTWFSVWVDVLQFGLRLGKAVWPTWYLSRNVRLLYSCYGLSINLLEVLLGYSPCQQ
jgi:hypothetical protein